MDQQHTTHEYVKKRKKASIASDCLIANVRSVRPFERDGNDQFKNKKEMTKNADQFRTHVHTHTHKKKSMGVGRVENINQSPFSSCSFRVVVP